MKKNKNILSIAWIFVLLLSCSNCTNTENIAIEKQILPVSIWIDRSIIKSSIYVEFPVVKNEISFDQFMKIENKGPEDKVLEDYFNCYLRREYRPCRESFRNQQGEQRDEKQVRDFIGKDPYDQAYHKLFGFLPIGNRRIYLAERSIEGEDEGEHFFQPTALFRRSNGEKFVHVFGSFAFYESYPMHAYWYSKQNPSEYKSIQNKALNTKGNNFIKLIPDFDKEVVGDKWYKNKGEMPVAFYIKGNEFYVNIMDPDVDPEIFQQFPGLHMYHKYIKTIETGTKEEILDLHMRPESYKYVKEQISELTEEQMSRFRGRFSKNGHVRFMVDADPVFFVFYSLFDHQRNKPESEDLGMITIYKEADNKFKVGNYLSSSANLDDGIFSKTLFIDKILRPRVLSLITKGKIKK